MNAKSHNELKVKILNKRAISTPYEPNWKLRKKDSQSYGSWLKSCAWGKVLMALFTVSVFKWLPAALCIHLQFSHSNEKELLFSSAYPWILQNMRIQGGLCCGIDSLPGMWEKNIKSMVTSSQLMVLNFLIQIFIQSVTYHQFQDMKFVTYKCQSLLT